VRGLTCSCGTEEGTCYIALLVDGDQGCSGAGTRGNGVGTRPPLPPLFWTGIRAKVSPLAIGYLLKRSVR